jgi:hypothetical protein
MRISFSEQCTIPMLDFEDGKPMRYLTFCPIPGSAIWGTNVVYIFASCGHEGRPLGMESEEHVIYYVGETADISSNFAEQNTIELAIQRGATSILLLEVIEKTERVEIRDKLIASAQFAGLSPY